MNFAELRAIHARWAQEDAGAAPKGVASPPPAKPAGEPSRGLAEPAPIQSPPPTKRTTPKMVFEEPVGQETPPAVVEEPKTNLNLPKTENPVISDMQRRIKMLMESAPLARAPGTMLTPREAPEAPAGGFVSSGNYNFDGMSFDQVFTGLIHQESRGRHKNAKGNLTTSSAGARGITQVMPKTGQRPGYGVRPLQNDSEAEYLRFGNDYFAAMVKQFKGNIPKALAAYNGGVGTVNIAVSKARAAGKPETWEAYLPKESRDYVRLIHGHVTKANKKEK